MIDFLIIKLSNHSKVNKLRAERHTHVTSRVYSCRFLCRKNKQDFIHKF